MTWIKGDVPTYITEDVVKRLHEGEQEIIVPMCKDLSNKSIVDYLNEYHNKNHYWDLTFLHVAFDFIEERIKRRLSKFSDIDIEILKISDTDRRIVIKLN